MKTILIIILSTNLLQGQYESSKHCEYLQNAKAIATLVEFKYDIPVAITMAVSILESGYGTSYAAKTRCNYFGMNKGKKKYISMYESFMDFGTLLATAKRYNRLKCIDHLDVFNYAEMLNICGFNPHPDYWRKLAVIIKQYELELIN